jgi:broad specificity phosphatase PhoE
MMMLSHASCKSQNDQRYGIRTRQKRVKYEEQKVLVITHGATIVDPGAVVIHLNNASPTHTAMVSTQRLERLAATTKS